MWTNSFNYKTDKYIKQNPTSILPTFTLIVNQQEKRSAWYTRKEKEKTAMLY